MQTLVTVMAVAALAATISVSGQQYQQSAGNYVDDYADYEAPRPAHPSPRSYSSVPAPAQRQSAPSGPKPTPVAILKQINRHNEDGSYTYGFEGADGSFKIETKLPNGEVKGKYGFVDDTGKVRVVEYGANKYGFQPSGEGITVAPPTLVDETTGKDGQSYQDYDYQQQAARPQQPLRAASRPIPAAPPRQQQAYQQPQYGPAAAQQPQSHTQAIYAPQQVARSQIQSAPKPAIFTPAAAAPRSPQFGAHSPVAYSAPRPSPTQQSQPVYEEPTPASQAFNQGPVQFSPAPVQAHRPQPRARSQQSGGILDQLARDYALPQGGAAPLHDISFGYY